MTRTARGLGLLFAAAALRAETPAAPAVATSPSPAVAVSTATVPAPSTAPFAWRSLPNKAFGPGESLLFVIKYGFISGGHAFLEVRSTEPVHGRAALRIVSEARTNSTIDVFYKVRDLYESWMDAEALCSHRYRQVLNEGRHHREVESRYDQENGTFAYWKKSRKGGESRAQGPIPPFVHDVLTSLYFLRTVPLVKGQDVVLQVNSGAQTWPLHVKVKGVEKVKVPAGKFKCWRVEPIIAGDGLFMQTGDLEVWLTDDERRMPVLMRSKVMVGAFTAELVEHEQGRAQLRSLIHD